MSKNKQIITINISKDLVEELQQMARGENRNFSNMVETLLYRFKEGSPELFQAQGNNKPHPE